MLAGQIDTYVYFSVLLLTVFLDKYLGVARHVLFLKLQSSIMPSYDDDLPTQQEELLLKQLVDSVEEQERIHAILEVQNFCRTSFEVSNAFCALQVKNLVIGSKRCKTTFYRVGTLDTLFTLLKEFSSSPSSSNQTDPLIEIIDCISSFVKSANKSIAERLIELGCIQQLVSLLSSRSDSIRLCESCLRCLRSFFLPKLPTATFSKIDYSNPFLHPLPFVLLCDPETHKPPSFVDPSRTSSSVSPMEPNSPIDILFEHVPCLDTLTQLLSTSPFAQLAIVEILCCLCVDNDRQQQLMEKNLVSPILHLLVQHAYEHDAGATKPGLVR